MVKFVLLLVTVIACTAAALNEDSKSPEKEVAPPTDLKTDATFWWGYRPVSYRAYYARPRSYGYYAPYYNSYWRNGWSGYNYYW